jgi:hypothetical protein
MTLLVAVWKCFTNFDRTFMEVSLESFLSFVQVLFLQHLVSLTCMTDWVLKEQCLTKGFGIYIKLLGINV